MRILYVDVDCLRPDHLGCYGYARPTSPHIDGIAAGGLRFDGVYASDVPCLPSRTAFFSGRFGVHTGVVGHGGTNADPYPDGPTRGFGSMLGRTSFMRCLRDRGLYTATISSFGERHSAFHFYANFNEVQNPGLRGLESAHVISDLATDWLDRHGQRDAWFLHVHLWDPHMPYRAPASEGNPFAAHPLPPWLNETVRQKHAAGCGPHSAREVIGFADQPPPELKWDYPRQPLVIDSMDAVRAMFDGYDTGVRYADRHVGLLLEKLRTLGIADDVAIIISGDHGESLGELNVYGDHQTADETTTHIPFVLRWPGITDAHAGKARSALHYQIDLAATTIQLLGGTVPANWDGVGFADTLRAGDDVGREFLVTSQGAWTCQRGVRLRDQGRELFYIHTRHDGYHLFPPEMLFDLGADPHQQENLADANPALVSQARALLKGWLDEALSDPRQIPGRPDPLYTVLNEGGPKHIRGELPTYLQRLRDTGRAPLAEALATRHPDDCT